MAKHKTPEAIREQFGEAIRLRRQEQGMSQQALAEVAGIRKATLIDIEKGRPCELNTLLSILSLLKGQLKIEW